MLSPQNPIQVILGKKLIEMQNTDLQHFTFLRHQKCFTHLLYHCMIIYTTGIHLSPLRSGNDFHWGHWLIDMGTADKTWRYVCFPAFSQIVILFLFNESRNKNCKLYCISGHMCTHIADLSSLQYFAYNSNWSKVISGVTLAKWCEEWMNFVYTYDSVTWSVMW